MPLIKLATAARRARMGSVTAIRRALLAAGTPLVTLSPGVQAVEEDDLNRFLTCRTETVAPTPVQRHDPPPTPTASKKVRKRRQ